MRLVRDKSFRAAVVQRLVIEGARTDGAVEALDGRGQRARRHVDGGGQLADGARDDRREHRRHEPAGDSGVDDRIRDLIRLLRDEASPDRVAFRPVVLAFVVEPIAMLVDHDPERHRVEARDDAAVELRRARIDGDGMTLGRIADRIGAGVEHQPQDRARVVRGTPDDEVPCRLSPDLLEPLEVRLEAAGREDDRAASDVGLTIGHAHRCEWRGR